MENPFTPLNARLENIENLLLDIKHGSNNSNAVIHSDQWLDLNQLINYDPEKRSKSTFYGYVHNQTIPYHKNGKKLLFLKAEIDEWLKSGRRKTTSELMINAENYIKRKTS
ncbi:helix-turn-helix domain-containing protein [Pontimicrobium sp. SW4]|uniref:Helix-turn-helix domain-containing protein n=1 Tax=Pontimicrobium sp. SW4 TaxID=3153519 RepID=A0AAU7BRS9_9FLAO